MNSQKRSSGKKNVQTKFEKIDNGSLMPSTIDNQGGKMGTILEDEENKNLDKNASLQIAGENDRNKIKKSNMNKNSIIIAAQRVAENLTKD